MWSDDKVSLKQRHRTPYVLAVHYGGPKLKGGFPDVANSGFRTALANELAAFARKGADKDPYCIGAFIDNELHPWTDDEKVAETYFSTCREEMRKTPAQPPLPRLPFRLPLLPGGRPQGTGAHGREILRHSQFQPLPLHRPTNCACPTVPRTSPSSLANSTSAPWIAAHSTQDWPASVHKPSAARPIACSSAPPCAIRRWWAPTGFQYSDHPITGRFDGENYQIGFVDICDTPYTETIAASREMGADALSIPLHVALGSLTSRTLCDQIELSTSLPLVSFLASRNL